jgi:hypothetical protein
MLYKGIMMLSKILKRNHILKTNDHTILYFFEEGNLKEHDIAREIIPLLKKYDAKGEGKLRILPNVNNLNPEVPDMLLKPMPAGKGSTITGISIPIVLHEEFISQLMKLGYTVE